MNQINDQMASGPPANALTAGLVAASVVVLLGYFTFRTPAPVPTPAAGGAVLTAPPALAPCLMDQPGLLRGQVFGSLSLAMDWQGPALACAGGPRPGNKGLRLFFAGKPAGTGSEVVLVLGIDGDLESLAGSERAAGITLNDEGTHRFFHADAGRCFTRVSSVTPLAGPPGRNFRIDGVAWCVGALPSVSDEASITLGDLRYSGRLSVDAD
jgi:hypothetical protein